MDFFILVIFWEGLLDLQRQLITILIVFYCILCKMEHEHVQQSAEIEMIAVLNRRKTAKERPATITKI